MDNLPGYLYEFIKPSKNGCYSFIYDNFNGDQSFSFRHDIPKHEIIFDELTFKCRYQMDMGLLYYIAMVSGKNLKKLIIPHGSFISNLQIKHIFSFLDFNIITHLDIHIPILNDEMTEIIINVINRGFIYHIGINPGSVSDMNNIRLMTHVCSKDHIRSISLYHKMFTTCEDVLSIYKAIRRHDIFEYMMIEVEPLQQFIDPKERGKSISYFLWSIRHSLVEQMDVNIQKRLPAWFFSRLFDNLRFNYSLTSLNIINHDIDITNGLELMRDLYNRNHMITHLSFQFKERKRSIRLREKNRLIQSFCERNLNLSKRLKTLFEIMSDEIDLNHSEKRQRVY